MAKMRALIGSLVATGVLRTLSMESILRERQPVVALCGTALQVVRGSRLLPSPMAAAYLVRTKTGLAPHWRRGDSAQNPCRGFWSVAPHGVQPVPHSDGASQHVTGQPQRPSECLLHVV